MSSSSNTTESLSSVATVDYFSMTSTSTSEYWNVINRSVDTGKELSFLNGVCKSDVVPYFDMMFCIFSYKCYLYVISDRVYFYRIIKFNESMIYRLITNVVCDASYHHIFNPLF